MRDLSSHLPFKIGTRGSPLAMVQARQVQALLQQTDPQLATEGAVEIVQISTSGDRIQDRPLSEVGGKGLFTKEIEEALFSGQVDVAVHSTKDVATILPDGLQLSCYLPREDPRDALFAGAGVTSLAELPEKAVVGTASLRRQAMVKRARPDISTTLLRGNVATRLKKLANGDVDATLLAVAGLKRLQQQDKIVAPLATDGFLPAVAQGIVSLETRLPGETARDQCLYDLLQNLTDRDATLAAMSERACLQALDGSCRTPIAAYGTLMMNEGQIRLTLQAEILLPDGSVCIHQQQECDFPDHPIATAEMQKLAFETGFQLGLSIKSEAGSAFFDKLAAQMAVEG